MNVAPWMCLNDKGCRLAGCTSTCTLTETHDGGYCSCQTALPFVNVGIVLSICSLLSFTLLVNLYKLFASVRHVLWDVRGRVHAQLIFFLLLIVSAVLLPSIFVWDGF